MSGQSDYCSSEQQNVTDSVSGNINSSSLKGCNFTTATQLKRKILKIALNVPFIITFTILLLK